MDNKFAESTFRKSFDKLQQTCLFWQLATDLSSTNCWKPCEWILISACCDKLLQGVNRLLGTCVFWIVAKITCEHVEVLQQVPDHQVIFLITSFYQHHFLQPIRGTSYFSGLIWLNKICFLQWPMCCGPCIATLKTNVKPCVLKVKFQNKTYDSNSWLHCCRHTHFVEYNFIFCVMEWHLKHKVVDRVGS